MTETNREDMVRGVAKDLAEVMAPSQKAVLAQYIQAAISKLKEADEAMTDVGEPEDDFEDMYRGENLPEELSILIAKFEGFLAGCK